TVRALSPCALSSRVLLRRIALPGTRAAPYPAREEETVMQSLFLCRAQGGRRGGGVGGRVGVGAIIGELFVIFAAAKLAGGAFQRQPPVIGELLAGVLIGPYALGWIGVPGPRLVALFDDPAAAQEALALVYHVLA